MIHTGSRGLGHQVCTDALSACDRWGRPPTVVLLWLRAWLGSCLRAAVAKTDWWRSGQGIVQQLVGMCGQQCPAHSV